MLDKDVKLNQTCGKELCGALTISTGEGRGDGREGEREEGKRRGEEREER